MREKLFLVPKSSGPLLERLPLKALYQFLWKGTFEKGWNATDDNRAQDLHVIDVVIW